jgi:hypothetical protein
MRTAATCAAVFFLEENMPRRVASKAPAESAKQRTFALHWGSGFIEEEAIAVDQYHRTAIQLLKFTEGPAAGSYEIRFCYYDPRGRFQRSPLVVDEENLAELARALKTTPRLRGMLKKLVA